MNRKFNHRETLSPAWNRSRWVLPLIILCLLSAAPMPGCCAEASSPSEYQVKALFLFNFTKYVEWPSNAFAQAEASIVIGVAGEDTIGEDLKLVIEDKRVNGRSLALKRVDDVNEAQTCHILFITASEAGRVSEILEALKNLPVLTVGETEQFLQQGGMIAMVKKDNKIRLEINLNASRRAQVTISSRLLGVADTVLGKTRDRDGRD